MNTSDDSQSSTSDNILYQQISDGFCCGQYDYEREQENIWLERENKITVEFWRNIINSDIILDIWENGYKIPFFTLPEWAELLNNVSVLKSAAFVKNAILSSKLTIW